MKLYSTFSKAIWSAGDSLYLLGIEHDSEQWQSIKSPQPFHELLFYSFRAPIPKEINELQVDVKPNLPWAEDHFQERVGGKPLNPGVQYQNWPYYKNKPENDQHRKEEKFSHTYMERFWPRHAGHNDSESVNVGVRFEYGDLESTLRLLQDKPGTRQAFVPIFFPEDTGAIHGERVPCTIGYQFIIRRGFMHCIYTIRSCDYLRHFRDDVYLASRLTQWMCSGLTHDVQPGFLKMDIGSLHIFKQETNMLKRLLYSK